MRMYLCIKIVQRFLFIFLSNGKLKKLYVANFTFLKILNKCFLYQMHIIRGLYKKYLTFLYKAHNTTNFASFIRSLSKYSPCNSEHFGTTKSAQDISVKRIRHRKNEPTLLYSALIKKNSCAKLIVLRLMVTPYIGNMIAFLRCHYAYLSITITSKLSFLHSVTHLID